MNIFDVWQGKRSAGQAVDVPDSATQGCLMRLIGDTLGMQVRPQDEAAIARQLVARAQSLGLCLSAYCQQLMTCIPAHAPNDEWRWLIEHLTITESYFFRDRGQFLLLRHRLLPEIIRRQRYQASKNTQHRPSLRLWSAGCSSGEEAYSLAILLQQELPDYRQWDITILGTDINEQMLMQARSGLYSNWSFRAVDPSVQNLYFHRHQDGWRIREDVRDMVTFQFGNLAGAEMFTRSRGHDPFDLIICRNVFIYFEPTAIAQALQHFYEALDPQGYLLTGHTELQGIPVNQFVPCSFPESVVYQRLHPVLNRSTMVTPADREGGGSVAMSAVPKPTVPKRPPRSPSPTLERRSPQSMATSLSAKGWVQKDLPSKRSKSEGSQFKGASPELKHIQALMLQRQYAVAIQELQTVLKSSPKDSVVHYWLAQVYADMGEHYRAIAACEQAMQLDSLAINPCYLMAQIQEEQGNAEQAKALYKRIIYLVPESIQAYLELGALYAREGNQKRAIQVWRSALAIAERSAPGGELADNTAMISELQIILKQNLKCAERSS